VHVGPALLHGEFDLAKLPQPASEIRYLSLRQDENARRKESERWKKLCKQPSANQKRL
jgi:hypothetical protein